jgi:hypothetical protein
MFAENLNPEKSGQHEPEEAQTKDIGIVTLDRVV